MDLSAFEDGILIDLDSGMGPAEVFDEVARVLAKEEGLGESEQGGIKKAFLAREQEGTTAFGFGIAMPHVFDGNLKRTRVVVVRHGEGIDLGAFDGVPTNTLVCIAGPKGERETYLGLLKHVAQVSRDSRWRRFIIQSPSAAGVLDVLREAGAG